MLNFYRRFLPAAAKFLKPLTDALQGSQKGAEWLQWTAGLQDGQDGPRQSRQLAHPDPAAKLSLVVDASATHIEAALQQKRPGWEPPGFFSRKLDLAQVKDSAFDRELQAAFAGIPYFRFMLEARPFTVFTDHKPLTTSLFQ